ncbi:MAG: Xaa-Pro peptidase family protein [Nocardiaceae bacterium]|nr:Xaa-Pro peptidase family protein [Nocardiaceae bacterium]
MRPNHAARREALRRLVREADATAMLVTDLVNIRYLTGFTGSNAALLVHVHGDQHTLLCTDSRYSEQSVAEAPDLRVEIARACGRRLAEFANEAEYKCLAFEGHVVTVDDHAMLSGTTKGIELRPVSGLVEQLREVKDDGEIELIRQACAAADAALAALLEAGGLRPGRSEREVARDLEWRMFEAGADGVAFETIVATGANSAIPHHRPTDAELTHGDFVKLDFGALVDGYHSDMTRTFVLGAASEWQRTVYDVVLASQLAGCGAVRSGVTDGELDAASRDVIEAAGMGRQFTHGLGHGVGLRIHEAPAITKTGEGKLLSGAVVTVEPGVYFPGRGGVRIEDTLVVRDSGAELLTLTSKDLTIV